MLVGWSFPTWVGTSPFMRYRAAWKSSSAMPACRSELWTHWPFPELSRSRSAVNTPSAAKRPPAMSAIAAPVRIGPLPGAPVTDMRPLIPCAIWSKPGRASYGPSWPNPEMLARMMRGLSLARES